MVYSIKNNTGRVTKKQNVTLLYNDGFNDVKRVLLPQEELILNLPQIPASIKKLEMVGLITVSYTNLPSMKSEQPKVIEKPKQSKKEDKPKEILTTEEVDKEETVKTKKKSSFKSKSETNDDLDNESND